ncbi:MAG: ABC transporter ATP-binding protein [Clostridia bacterium]|nr:ABC transporter ATP-binding protein [Clostridia bacterium]
MIKRLWNYLGKYKILIVISTVLVVSEIIFDLTIPVLMSDIVDNGIRGEGGLSHVIECGIKMVALAIIAAIAGCTSAVLSARASAGLSYNMRNAVFHKIQDFSFGNIDKFSTPSLLTRLTRDTFEVRMAFIQACRIMIRGPIMLILTMFLAIRISPSLAIVLFIAIPVITTTFFLVFKNAHPMFVVMMDKYDKLNASIQENLIGIRVVKTFVRHDHEIQKFNNAATDVRDTQAKAERILSFNRLGMEICIYTCILAVAWFGGNMMIQERLSVGDFTRFISYINQIMMQLLMLNMATVQLVTSQTSAERIFEVLDEKIEISDENADPENKVKDGSIDFDHVNFSYSNNRENLTLEDIDLHIRSGETVGILGSTGTGKSTLVQLIPRLYDVMDGSVKVGGIDVRDYKTFELRENVAMVLQKNVLFAGTIKENLKWGNEDATDEEIIDACKSAQAHDFIMGFPEGYETFLGQGGVNVSGGQKQRLCIARALIKKPKIMIMDDSTSAVDTATDRKIRTALKAKLDGMTTIIIAQRVTSVMDADKIVIMDNGKITGEGTHDELMQSNVFYRELYESQQKGVE